MVHISLETVKRFKQIFKRDYGVEYSDEEAWEATHNLIGLFELLLKLDRKQNPDNYKKKINGDKKGGVNIQIKSDKIIIEK